MKNLVTLYIGMFDKDTHKQEYSIEYFTKVLDFYFDCYTLTQCKGRYKHEDGTIVNEPTLKVEFIDNNSSFDANTIKLIKNKLNQECIMVTIQMLQISFM